MNESENKLELTSLAVGHGVGLGSPPNPKSGDIFFHAIKLVTSQLCAVTLVENKKLPLSDPTSMERRVPKKGARNLISPIPVKIPNMGVKHLWKDSRK